MKAVQSLAVAVLVSSVTIFSGVASARAGHGCCKPDADIDTLKAEMTPQPGGWSLSIRYCVKIEDACPQDQFQLLVTLTECGCPVRDASGRPMTMAIPLVQPYKAKCDEARFRDCVSVFVPGPAICRPGKLKLEGRVVSPQSRKALDCDDTSVKVCGGCR